MEFALLLVIIIAALISMQIYLRRGIQGRLRDNIESLGGQYDPAATSSEYNFIEKSSSTSTTKVEPKVMGIQHCKDPANPYDCTETIDTATVTTIETQTHYDNSTRTGWEHVGDIAANAIGNAV